ncbi:iron ABC transporter permease [Kineothrix sedimenti]|uniref:Iron ABC transporter permease n=1 Tax=Kineothrix sedimenti TaxID=3123317 RepID=A0ABZ3EYA7_9FIRM
MKKVRRSYAAKGVAARQQIFIAAAILLLLGTLFLSMKAGYSSFTVMDTIQTLIGNGTEQQKQILFQFRLPRIILSTLIGSGLALSGCILQSITRNPLSDPGLLGINAGSGFMVMLYILFLGGESGLALMGLPLLSFAGAGLAAILVYLLAYRTEDKVTPVRLILTGLAVQAGISSLTTLLVVKMDETQFEFFAAWQAGQFWGAGWRHVFVVLPWMLLLMPLVLYRSRLLDICSLGDPTAVSLGVSMEKERRILLGCSVMLAASGVAIGGNIGFVGLLAPHLTRKIVGSRHEILLPGCALVGAVLVALADTVGRIIIQPSSIPTGIMTVLLGAPYFIFLLIKRK